jgi:hypothetical protein
MFYNLQNRCRFYNPVGTAMLFREDATESPVRPPESFSICLCCKRKRTERRLPMCNHPKPLSAAPTAWLFKNRHCPFRDVVGILLEELAAGHAK